MLSLLSAAPVRVSRVLLAAMSLAPPSAAPPRTVLGTMTFGGQMNAEQSAEAVRVFLGRGYNELDTAFMYMNGETERVLGGMGLTPEVKLATKANPWGGNTLRPESVRHQLETSLERLRAPSVHLFYLHAPDHQTPVEETLAACQQLYQEGKVPGAGSVQLRVLGGDGDLLHL